MLYIATDSDFDGVPNTRDAFPRDRSESIDTDGDGIGNNTDVDDDNDGVSDAQDWLPLDPSESVDTDGDGVGNNGDSDDDNDGIPDIADDQPLLSQLDSDGDGLPDRVDPFPNNPANNTDSDGDGVFDLFDVMPTRSDVAKAVSFKLGPVNRAGISESVRINRRFTDDPFDNVSKPTEDLKVGLEDASELTEQSNVVSWNEDGEVLTDIILSNETTFIAESILSPNGEFLYLLTSPHSARYRR